MIPRIYSYSEPHFFLRDVLRHKKALNPLFSVRAWSKHMGFRCHSSLVLLLNGKRPVRPEHLAYLNRGLRLEGDEEKYLRLLIHSRATKSEVERADIEARLKLLVPSKSEGLLDCEKFNLIADWMHMAILEMTKLKDFQSRVPWIAARLKPRRPTDEVSAAINRLLQLGLLERRAGKLVKTNERLSTSKNRGSESIREHHRQVLKNDSQAIDGQSIEERIFNSCAMTIKTNRLKEAQELISKFRADMAKLLEADDGDETYQLSIQLFKITQSQKGTSQ